MERPKSGVWPFLNMFCPAHLFSSGRVLTGNIKGDPRFLGVPETPAGGLRGQDHFHYNTKMLFAISTEPVDAWADGGKATVGKIAYNLARTKVCASNSTGCPVVFTTTGWQWGRKGQFSLGPPLIETKTCLQPVRCVLKCAVVSGNGTVGLVES